jgi:hypothetical protein
VDYVSWAPGEPNTCDNRNNCPAGEDVVEMDFRGTKGWNDGHCAACHDPDATPGMWNDQSVAGDGGIGKFPLCESIVYVADQAYQYKGCYKDAAGRDMDGLTQDGTTQAGASNGEDGVPPPFFVLGTSTAGDDGKDVIDGDPRAMCAHLCAGFKYFALQFYNQCFCDNANAMSQGSAEESECNTPCNGHDGSDGGEAVMCGGAWRNSVYQISTNNWESAGYDDTMVSASPRV